MGLFEDRRQREIELRKEFTADQFKGARWKVPGWDEANKRLDEAGIGVAHVMKPEPPSQG
jgi:hypothetical protein